MAGTIVVDRIESDASYASTINVAGQITFSNTVNFGAFAGTAPVAGFYLPTTNNLAFTTASTERMRIDSSGNVGIGTSSPTDRLDIRFATGTGNIKAGIVAGNNTKLYNTTGDLWVSSSDAASDVYLDSLRNVYFRTAGTNQVIVNASGNVGIGTSSPASKVHISQSGASTSLTIDGIENPIFAARYAANADGAVIFLAKSRNATVGSHTIVQNGDQIALLQARASNGTSFVDAASILFAVDGTPGAGSDMPGRIVFGTSPDGSTSVTERMRITSDGSLLINGTTQPVNTYKQVITFSGNAVGGGLLFNDGDSGNTYPAVYFRKDGAQRGNINVTTSGTTYNTVSDYRLKENIAPMTGALAKVALLKPCTYKWKVNGSDGQGFIAHELDEVVSGCVTGEKDAVDADGNPVYQGIDTSFLVATLTAAIQEQQALIQALTTRITALESN